MDVTVQRQTSGPQSHRGSVLSWSAPSLAGGSFSPSSLVTTVCYVADQNAPAISFPLEPRPRQVPIALGVFSDVCWGHSPQRGTAALLLLQAPVPALFSCQLSVPRPRASLPSLGLEYSTRTSLLESSCLSVHGSEVPWNPSVLQLLTPIHRHSEHPFSLCLSTGVQAPGEGQPLSDCPWDLHKVRPK